MFIRSLVALILLSAPLMAQDAQYLGSYRWQSSDPLHGGFSGLELTDDGRGYVTISDRGAIETGQLKRDARGVVSQVMSDGIVPLKGAKSDALPRYGTDAEGLAVGGDGTIYISFEGLHRIWSYASVNARAVPLPAHPDFKSLQNNSGLEALAIDAQGRLLTMPERSGERSTPFPVYRNGGGTFGIVYRIPRSGEYLPVGMDVGPDGQLYVLERWFRGIGFSSRVRRFDISGNTADGEVTLVESGLGVHDNLEGIAVWRDAQGIRITMISDDNFKPFQVTEFVDYRVIE
ncbi:esterase-like activity of phytase family protein [Celeribacter marinus]|uniref:esterase-like activity of phytase family protein n=1 Tax=Celeribacter marinus TaxID=1397108 RepID=UPI003179190A